VGPEKANSLTEEWDQEYAPGKQEKAGKHSKSPQGELRQACGQAEHWLRGVCMCGSLLVVLFYNSFVTKKPFLTVEVNVCFKGRYSEYRKVKKQEK
jgi:hypothetical protein